MQLSVCLKLAPILSPTVDGFHHLWKECTDALIDKILEEVYRLLVVQVESELFLKLHRTMLIKTHVGLNGRK